MLTTIVAVVVVLGGLIFFHELGHFLIARLFGIGVTTFSLGFGPKILKHKWGKTEYALSLIPLGGYVAMVGESDAADLPPGFTRSESFALRPAWQRLFIIAAGPVSNILLAWFLCWSLIYGWGAPVIQPIVGEVKENAPAAAAGLVSGDRIEKIDGKAIKSWEGVTAAIEASQGQPLQFEVIRKEGDRQEIQQLTVIPEKLPHKTIFGEDETTWQIGAYPWLAAVIGAVEKDSPAANAGLEPGDRIAAIDGKPVNSWEAMSSAISASSGRPMTLEVTRENEAGLTENLRMILTAEKSVSKNSEGQEVTAWRIGIKAGRVLTREPEGFWAASITGAKETWRLLALTWQSFIKLAQRVVPLDQVGGPIMIAQMVGEQAHQGLGGLLFLTALISVNLGILNLLPIPVLDGGQIVFCIYEMIFRRPLPVKAQEYATRAGLFLLLALMALATFNDVWRLVK